MNDLERKLRGCFESQIFARGQAYFKDGSVLEYDQTDPDNFGWITVTAQVIGSEDYDVTVYFDEPNKSFEEFECTCPYAQEGNCKHAAALGLGFINRYADRFNSERLSSKVFVKPKNKVWVQNKKMIPSCEQILSAFDDSTTPEDIEKVIEQLKSFKQQRVQHNKRQTLQSAFQLFSGYNGTNQSEHKIISGKNPISVFKPVDYFIKFSQWGVQLSLYHKNDPYQYVNINRLLNHKEILTPVQHDLLMILKTLQTERYNSAPSVDFSQAFELIKESGITLRNDDYGYNRKIMTIDTKPDKLTATLKLEEKYNEYLDKTIRYFVIEIPAVHAGSYKYKFFYGSRHLIQISEKTVAMHEMSPLLARIITRAVPGHEYGSSWRRNSVARVKLTDEEVIQINKVIQDAQQYLDLTTSLVSDYEIEEFKKAVAVLLVDFSSENEILTIRPVMDYGCFEQDVSESVFVSHAGGRESFKRRQDWENPDKYILVFEGKRIRYALIQAESEIELFTNLYNKKIGLTKTGKCTVRGFSKIYSFYNEYWPKLESKCKEIGCEVRFSRDVFNFASENFRAEFSIDLAAENDWFAFDVGCYCGPDKITLEDLRRFIDEGREFIRQSDGRLLKITNIEELERFVAMLESFKEREEGHFEGKIYNAPEIEYIATSSKSYNTVCSKGFKALLKDIKAGKPVKPVKLSPRISSILRDYQIRGVEWLYFLRSYHFAGILADDMGLGKTVQALVLLEKERIPKKPSLVVCPKTLLYNWQAEAKRFTPELKTVVIDGFPGKRAEIIKNAARFDLLITGYATLKKDSELYKAKGVIFNYCVLDEAQFIKNHAAKNSQVAKEVNADYRLALTGTPLENSVSELWSIFDFLMPGFLGSYKTFTKRFHKPIMEAGDLKALETLRKKVECFMLRRTKKEVLTELPPKVEQISNCRLDTAQNLLYQEVLSRVKKDVFKTVKERGFNKSQIHILAGLTKLRQVCNHPALLLKTKKYNTHASAKLEMFNELVEEVCENKRKVLVFSQFTEMLDILAKELRSCHVPYAYLSGKTRNRQEIVNSFNNDPNIPVFLISLRAGGTGLNLTSADTVIIFDPWWNPSVENQAIDRTHRIGQKKSVNVYRLITSGTIEEKIVALQQKKKKLFDSLVDESKDLFQKLTWEDVQEIFR